MSHYRLSSLFAPRSIALVGASPQQVFARPGDPEKSRATRLQAAIDLVNPRYSEIAGLPVVKSLRRSSLLRPGVDVITVPPRRLRR